MVLYPVPIRDFSMGEPRSSLPSSLLLRKAISRRGLAGFFNRDKRKAYWRLLAKKRRRAAARLRHGDEGGPADRGSSVRRS